tara:strand:+ start:1342 stop:1491 length:150 start_codon:yes stop_codon:yes gene_type:complete
MFINKYREVTMVTDQTELRLDDEEKDAEEGGDDAAENGDEGGDDAAESD